MGKVLLCSRVPMDWLEGSCPDLGTVPAAPGSSRSAVETGDESSCPPGMGTAGPHAWGARRGFPFGTGKPSSGSTLSIWHQLKDGSVTTAAGMKAPATARPGELWHMGSTSSIAPLSHPDRYQAHCLLSCTKRFCLFWQLTHLDRTFQGHWP